MLSFLLAKTKLTLLEKKGDFRLVKLIPEAAVANKQAQTENVHTHMFMSCQSDNKRSDMCMSCSHTENVDNKRSDMCMSR